MSKINLYKAKNKNQRLEISSRNLNKAKNKN